MRTIRLRYVAAATTMLFSTCAFSQNYPDRAIRIVVPYLPGGGVDAAARLVGQPMSEFLGQSIVVDNRPGAATNIGSDMVAKAKPDGYTLLLANPSQVANVSLYSNMPYSLQKDLAPVVLIGVAPLILLVHPSLPVKSVRDLIALAKAKPNQLTYASAGIGSPTHIATELFKWMAGVKIDHIPYKGGSQAVIDIIAGRVTLYFSAASTGLPLVRTGKLRALGVTGTKRFAAAPEVPTVSEGGLPGYEIVNWFALLTPTGTPQDAIAKLNAAANKVVARADTGERLSQQGIEPTGGTPQALGAYLEKEIVKYGNVVRAAHIKPE
jgi:tripartite-type tricarboxylate transporter receptor subunit TctC